MFALDYVWVQYMKAATNERPTRAANYAALLFLVGAGNTLAYVNDPTLLVPGAVGAWAGTFSASGGLA